MWSRETKNEPQGQCETQNQKKYQRKGKNKKMKRRQRRKDRERKKSTNNRLNPTAGFAGSLIFHHVLIPLFERRDTCIHSHTHNLRPYVSTSTIM